MRMVYFSAISLSLVGDSCRFGGPVTSFVGLRLSSGQFLSADELEFV